MSNPAKSDQRLLEQSFYRDHASRHRFEPVDFAPIEGRERRPWNPYWYDFETLRTRFVGPWQRLLDFGCGAGDAAIRLARLGYQVDGFDPSPENCDAAAALARQYELTDRCEFAPMSADKLAYDDRFFDLVAGFDALQGVEVERAVAEIHRVLKPSGVAVIKDHAAPAIIDEFKRQFERVDVARFTLLSGIDRIVRRCDDATRGRIQRLDHRVIQLCPPLASLGGTAVLICQKHGYC